MTLTADHADWLALLWVHQGGVVTYRGIYLERDRPLPRFLFPELLLDVLVADGLLAVAQPDDQGRARVSLTETGSVRLVQLCEQLARRPMPLIPRASGWHSDQLGASDAWFPGCGLPRPGSRFAESTLGRHPSRRPQPPQVRCPCYGVKVTLTASRALTSQRNSDPIQHRLVHGRLVSPDRDGWHDVLRSSCPHYPYISDAKRRFVQC